MTLLDLQDFQDAFILLLSGCVEKDGSVKWQDDLNDDVFIKFPTQTLNYAIVSYYWKNGNKCCEAEYKNGLMNGKYLGWWENGNKKWDDKYKNGMSVGKSIGWYENGDLWWKEE